MFEREAEEYTEKDLGGKYLSSVVAKDKLHAYKLGQYDGFIEGAEFGYNKANEWHYVKDELPKKSGRYFVYVGGGENSVYPLDFETEYNDFGYWCVEVASDSLGVTDTIFETITERNEDKVIAWKEIVLPELKESE